MPEQKDIGADRVITRANLSNVENLSRVVGGEINVWIKTFVFHLQDFLQKVQIGN